jgi:hypothetical protein
MTPIHWLYVLGVITVILTMIFRRNVVIPCVVFTFIIGWMYKASFVGGVQVVFNASLVAAKDLFSVFLIIGLMMAMLKSLVPSGADQLMVKPLRKMIVNPVVSYIVLCASTFIISLFFWPTPAVPLIGALLVPAAVQAGLPPMMGAMAMALAGQGMALSSDMIIQGAPMLTANAAGIPVELVTTKVGILSIIAGIVAISLGYFFNKKDILAFKKSDSTYIAVAQEDNSGVLLQENKKTAVYLTYLLIIAMVFVIVSMFAFNITGGDASALLGGVAVIIMLVASLANKGVDGLDVMADYLTDGLVFAFKVMGQILPIAGFFYIGNPESVVGILGEGAPGYLFDVGKIIAQFIPPTGLLAGFGLLILGAITGLDGSGFSGLPLTGTLAGAIASGDAGVAATLGSIGQLGAIWAGGGTLVAWCSLVAVSGICGVSVLDLVRKNFLPVVIGLVVATLVGVFFMM